MPRCASITGGARRCSQLLKATVGISSGNDGSEEDQWVVGGRYQVTHQTALHQRPDLTSETSGHLRPKDIVILLALQSVPVQSGDPGDTVLLAYVANTKNPEFWVCGWGAIEGEGATPQALRRRRLPGSWEVGGRYMVVGSPVLRAQIELESEQLCEVNAQEEVLILDLGLVIRSGEPRLRARVRIDSGDLGWLTMEVPGGSALLDPLNLYSAEALHRKPQLFGEKHRRHRTGSSRVSVSGQSERSDQVWEISGKYRLVERVSVHTDADINSRIIGELRKGSLVTVVGLEHPEPFTASSWPLLRLQITNEHTDAVGWISPLSEKGEKLLDSRDHLEFEKIMRLEMEELEEQQDQGEQNSQVHSPEESGCPQDMDYRKCKSGESSSVDQASEEHHSNYESASNGASPDLHEKTNSNSDKTFTGEAANVALISEHAKKVEAEPINLHHRHDEKFSHNVARPWDTSVGSGYRAFHEMEAAGDERQVGDSLENEGYSGICACRNSLLNCGVDKVWYASKAANGPSAPHYPGEAPPGAHPMYPPGAHASWPNN